MMLEDPLQIATRNVFHELANGNVMMFIVIELY